MITVLLAAIAGAVGVWLGGALLGSGGRNSPASLHDIVHHQLELTAEQEQKIDSIEREFAARTAAGEAEMRKANAALSVAIHANEHMGPEVTAAVHRIHEVMGVLQADTIAHVFAMRAILTPEQRGQFDDKIAEALAPASK